MFSGVLHIFQGLFTVCAGIYRIIQVVMAGDPLVISVKCVGRVRRSVGVKGHSRSCGQCGHGGRRRPDRADSCRTPAVGSDGPSLPLSSAQRPGFEAVAQYKEDILKKGDEVMDWLRETGHRGIVLARVDEDPVDVEQDGAKTTDRKSVV